MYVNTHVNTTLFIKCMITCMIKKDQKDQIILNEYEGPYLINGHIQLDHMGFNLFSRVVWYRPRK